MPKGPPKGTTNNPNGRPKGSENKATAGAREAIAKFVDGNAHRLARWLDQIAEENPMAAFDRYMSVVEYHIPKLQRSEITGKDGEKFQITIAGLEALPVKGAIEADYSVVDVSRETLALGGPVGVAETLEKRRDYRINARGKLDLAAVRARRAARKKDEAL